MPAHTHHDHAGPPTDGHVTAVLEVSGLQFATEKSVVESVLGRLPGVASVDANPVAQTATVTYDPETTSIAELRSKVEACGYHCAGQSVPDHVCMPMEEPSSEEAEHIAHEHAEADGRSSHEVMGHGGHDGTSMADMVTDMRRRFLVAALFSVPILLWSEIGRDVLNFEVDAPFGLRDDVFQLILSLPVVFWSAWIFFDGAVRALRARTLDMMVLVAVAVGAGWLYSVGVTLTGGGEVFYEAATVLSAFVLLGHWFEMRARGGANDAIRALLNLAPPMAVVLRDGEPVEIPTVGVAIGAGTDVAIETADVVLMRSDPLDVAVALRIGWGTLRKMRQNLGWAVGYNVIALPIAAGVFEPAFGLVLRPEIAALSMSGSSFIVAVNAVMLKRLHLPAGPPPPEEPARADAQPAPVPA